MTKITLPWMDKLRARLEDRSELYGDTSVVVKYKEIHYFTEFLEPIMEYGEAEEKRISDNFKNELSERIERVRMDIVASGYDHFPEIKEVDLDVLLNLSWKIRRREDEDTK